MIMLAQASDKCFAPSFRTWLDFLRTKFQTSSKKRYKQIAMKQFNLLFVTCLLLFQGCIGDDFVLDTVEPTLRIVSNVDTIGIEESFQFESLYLNNIGAEESVSVSWQSSDPSIIRIDTDGLAQALAVGSSTISAEVNDGDKLIRDEREVYVGASTVEVSTIRMGEVVTTSSYKLNGRFTLSESEDGVVLAFGDDYEASTALPGLYVYLTNNRNTTANALEIGAVEVFSGEHSYLIPNVTINDYSHVLYFCKPFNVKVGDGEIL